MRSHLLVLALLLVIIYPVSAVNWTSNPGGYMDVSCSNPAFSGSGNIGTGWSAPSGSIMSCYVSVNSGSSFRIDEAGNVTNYCSYVDDCYFLHEFQLGTGQDVNIDLRYEGGPTQVGYARVTMGNPLVDASWTVNPASGVGYAPLTAVFTDTSTGSPTSWSWDFGDGDTTNNTQQNPVHTFSNAGTYSVKLNASKTGSSDWYNQSYVVNAYQAPGCNFTMSVSSGSSPLGVTFTDTSVNSPTSYLWLFNPDAAGWLTVYPSETNTTSNPVAVFEGTGNLRIYHESTNPAGTGVCPYQYLNLSGVAPNPTPTPGIPFPNQTGICLNEPISLGSQWQTGYDSYYSVEMPDGNAFNGYYGAGSTRLSPGDTSQIGQYFYEEYNLSNTLEWRMSYIVQSCYTPTPTPTITPSFTYTAIPTGTSNPYPTVTWTMASPSTPINGSKVTPFVNISSIPPTLPDLPSFLDEGTIKAEICEASFTGSFLCPLTDFIYNYESVTLGYIFAVTSIAIAPFAYLVIGMNYSWSLAFTILSSWLSVGSIIVAVLGQLVNAIPDKVKNVITLIMCLDIIKQGIDQWDWV